MPVYRYLLHEFSLTYVTARYPFVPDNLATQAERDVRDLPTDNTFALPIVLDLRSIDLLAYSTEDFKLLLSRRQSLNIAQPAPPCAYLVRDEGSFGMLRVFTNYAEVRGFRHEGLTMITTDPVQAVDWIYPRLQAPQRSQLDLLAKIETITDSIDGRIAVA